MSHAAAKQPRALLPPSSVRPDWRKRAVPSFARIPAPQLAANARHKEEIASFMPTRKKYIEWSNIQDRDLAMSLTLCEKERHACDDILRSSSEWRKRWLEQQAKPLPPPTPRSLQLQITAWM